VHLAVAAGHRDILELLLEHDSEQVLRTVCPFIGFYPLHVAAVHRQVACARLLLEYGARVTQLTDETPSIEPEQQNRYTVFHLAASRVAKRRFKLFNEKVKVAPSANLLENASPDDDYEEEERKTFEILDLFLDYLPPEPLRVVTDSRFGSVVHYFAAINYAAGIERVVAAPYGHPPDGLNAAGCSPLLVGLNNHCLDAVLQLLAYPLDVERLDPNKKLTPLQLLITDVLKIREEHLTIVDKLLEQGKFLLKYTGNV
jgi:Ankyrin repeats (3 copies)